MRLRNSLALKLALVTMLSLGVSACGGLSAPGSGGGESATEQCQAGSETCSTDGMASGHAGMGDGMAHTMDLGPADATYDLRFIDAMIMHHEGAITMAEAALANSEREEIRQLAEAIIAAQTTEIAQMQEWRQAWYPNAGSEPVMYHAEMNHDMPMSKDMAAAMRMDMDLGTADDEFDLRFINAMIPHHEGAWVMAEDLKTKSSRPEMQTLAADIISAQQAEIDQMKTWRQSWYGQ